ncbi:MAG TPA: CDP-alcohol phosphatidyltransferase family protein [Desulfosarcina sp.]|nr:CDP-alcohol phosphatidyltransferase family protein [Desulfosarcina sp.]
MANLITLARFVLVFILVVLAYVRNPAVQTITAPLVVLIFLLDGVDGFVARKRREETLFGALFDIATDRMVENVLWLVLVDLDIIPVWVAIIFLARSFVVDAIRSHGTSAGLAPFRMMRSPLARFLVAGRFMRVFYAVLKCVTFGYIFLIQPWPDIFPNFYAAYQSHLMAIKWGLVYATVALCLVRGLPVVYEFTAREGGLFAAFRK